MRTWLRCLAWRLVGFKLIPLKPGDLVILHVDDTDIDLNHFRAFATSVYARGAKLNVKNKFGWTPLLIAEGLYFGNNNSRSDAAAALLRTRRCRPASRLAGRPASAKDRGGESRKTARSQASTCTG